LASDLVSDKESKLNKIVYGILIVSLILLGCSGKDKITTDKTPPLPPDLIQHLGDTGDLPVHYPNPEDNLTLDENNNGIDAVPDGNWIRVSWEHLLDSDLDYLRVYRFDAFDPLPALIDSISATSEYYVDSSSQLNTNILYSYFIEAVDNAGNSTRSDTVSYSLLSKQRLISSGWDNTYQAYRFDWQKSGSVASFRLLIMDANGGYLWHRDIQVTTEGDFFFTLFPNSLIDTPEFANQELRWRVDAFDLDFELGIYVGSESEERTFSFPAKK
jgi:hypothetical protein